MRLHHSIQHDKMECRHLGLSTFWCVDVLVCRRFGLSMFWSVDVLVCGRFGLSTFWFVDVLVCGRFGLSTFRFVDVLVCRRFGCRRFGLSTFWPVTLDIISMTRQNKNKTNTHPSIFSGCSAGSHHPRRGTSHLFCRWDQTSSGFTAGFQIQWDSFSSGWLYR